MRVLILGGGPLGAELHRHLRPDHEVRAQGRADRPADLDAILAEIREHRPNLVVHAAGPALDRQVHDPDTTLSWNVRVPAALAGEADRWGVPLVHVSSASVFDGRKGTPYTEDDAPAPTDPIGRTALLGEQAVAAGVGPAVIFRTGWIYDQGDLVGRPPHRPETLEASTRVSPTWARDAAVAVWRALGVLAGPGSVSGSVLGARLRPGDRRIFHLAAEGGADAGELEAHVDRVGSRFGLATWVDTGAPGEDAEPGLDYRLDAGRLEAEAGIRLPDWRVGVESCLRDVAARRELLTV